MTNHPTRLVGSLRPFRRQTSQAVACGLFMSFVSSTHAMDLLQAYEQAQARDATILMSRAAAQASRERGPQALAQLLPNVSLSVGLNQNAVNRTDPGVGGAPVSTQSNYSSNNQTVSIRQPLYRPYQWAQYQQAKAQVADTDAVQKDDEQNLVVRVASTYFDVLLAKDQLTIVLSQKKANETYLDAARKRVNAGAVARTDADEAQARLDMTLAQEVEARQQVDFTLRQLQALVDQPINEVATLDSSKFVLMRPEPDSPNAWIDRAELNNPQVAALRARLDAARIEVEKAKTGHRPTLDAVAQLSRSESENPNFISSRYTTASIGLQLNVPLYAGGSVNSQVRQALSAQQAAEQAREVGRRDLGIRVHKEFRGVTENLAKTRALEQSLRSVDQLILSNQRSLQAGSRTLVDVLNAEQQKAGVLKDLSQARYLHLLSKVRLWALVDAADMDALRSINNYLSNAN